MLIVALSGDWLFMPEQSAELVTALIRNRKRVSYCHLDAPAGHDAFLTHITDLTRVIRAFLPWVGTPETGAVNGDRFDELEDAIIAGLVQPGSRVLDLGCGNGDLLSRLERERQVAGTGVEIDIGHIVRTIDAGHNALLEDINDGLQMIPDDSYDVAVLGETLQVVLRPREVLHQILRVAREAVVAFPNFGYLPVRGSLLLKGRMPKANSLPYEWYDTPNIHLFTLADFLRLCEQDGLTVKKIHGLSRSWVGRLLCRLGLRNLGADRVIAHIVRPPNTEGSCKTP
jgi:homoserine O-acetyltransferase